MTKTMKVEGPLHVICQCDKCKPQISFNAKVIGYVAPQRTWVELTDDDCLEALKAVDPETKRLPLALSMFAANIQAKLKEKNCG